MEGSSQLLEIHLSLNKFLEANPISSITETTRNELSALYFTLSDFLSKSHPTNTNGDNIKNILLNKTEELKGNVDKASKVFIHFI